MLSSIIYFKSKMKKTNTHKKKSSVKLKKEAGEVQFFEFIHRRPVCPFPESRRRVDIVQCHCPTVDSLLVWSDPCRLRWCQSLVLEVFFEGLGQREPLDLLQPVPTQRHAGGTSTQVHQRQRLSWGEARTQRSGKLTSCVTTRLYRLCKTDCHSFYLRFCLNRITGYVLKPRSPSIHMY